MRRLCALAAGVLMLAGCSLQHPSNAASAPDPCSLLSAGQVTVLTGGPTRAAMPTGTGDGCNYAAIDGAKVSLLVTLQSNETAAGAAEQRRLAVATGADVQDLAGIGDGAFSYSAQGGTAQSAEARVGNTGVRVLLIGPGASADHAKQALAEALTALRS